MKVAIIGTGYVGLVTGACLANQGNETYCADTDELKISMLKGGKLPIYEYGLDDLVSEGIKSNRLTFTTNVREAVSRSEIVFLAVGTPQNQFSRDADLTYLFRAAEDIAASLKENDKLIVCKSTVPPGTADLIEQRMKARTTHRFYVASNPEFLAEGRAVEDFKKPDRIIIGATDERAIAQLKEIYLPFARSDPRKIIIMDRKSAELVKYGSNCFLAARISMINEIAVIADELGADISAVREGIGTDHRIGRDFLYPGPGFGGSCFPKDVAALSSLSEELGVHPIVLNAVLERNRLQREIPYQKLRILLRDKIYNSQIAVLGLAFKANTDDVRESPSINLISKLLSIGSRVKAYDPRAVDNFKEIISDKKIEYTDSLYEAVDGSAGLVIMTEWEEFRSPDFGRIYTSMKEPRAVVDARNLWDPRKIREQNFLYSSIGRP